jgi:hypothetical protein
MSATISLLASGLGERRTWSWGAVERKRLSFTCAAAGISWWPVTGAAGKFAAILIWWPGKVTLSALSKTRGGRNVATAESAVDHDKARVLRRIARQYLLAVPDTPDQVRFDVLSIYYEAQKAADIQLFRGAFEWR